MATADSGSSNLTTCPLCLEWLNNPRLLPCGHALCLNCAQTLFDLKGPGEEASCPTCRRQFEIPHNGAEGLPLHFYALDKTEQERKRIRLQESACDTHKDEQVKLYCLDCEKNICVLCVSVKHKDHKRSELSEVADNFRRSIDDHCNRIQSAIDGVRKQLEQVKKDASEFQRKSEDEKTKVTATADVVMRSVDTQRCEVLKKLDSVTSESVRLSQGVQEKYQQAIASLESFCRDSRELLDKDRASDITGAGCRFIARARELLDNVTDIEYHPPHVTFHPADVTQVKRLGLIGDLTVTTQERSGVESEEQGMDGQQLMQASDTESVLQDELIQAADRERQLQIQLDKMKDDVSRLQKRLEQPSILHKEFLDLEQEMKQRDMGQVIQTLPEGQAVMGITSLDDLLYVLRQMYPAQLEVYDIETYVLLSCVTIQGLGFATDMIACEHNRCAYICNGSRNSVVRVALTDAMLVTQWPVNDCPSGVSLTRTHSVLVSCNVVRKIKEYNTDGQLLHELTLPQDVVSPLHSVQLGSGQFLVCHGGRTGPLGLPVWVHRMCLIDSDGRVVKSFGGQPISGSQHMAVDENEFVFVANSFGVLLLSPLLTYVRDVVTREQLKWSPLKVHLDTERQHLYIADNEIKDGKLTAGRVVIVSV